MRKSTIIVIAHLYLDAAAIALEASGISEDLNLQFSTGVSENLDEAAQSLASINPSGGFGETLFALYVTVASSLEAFFSAVFAGPIMLTNLGAPEWAVVFVYVAATPIVGLDIAYALSGRDL
jgi:hypothetical protein